MVWKTSFSNTDSLCVSFMCNGHFCEPSNRLDLTPSFVRSIFVPSQARQNNLTVWNHLNVWMPNLKASLVSCCCLSHKTAFAALTLSWYYLYLMSTLIVDSSKKPKSAKPCGLVWHPHVTSMGGAAVTEVEGSWITSLSIIKNLLTVIFSATVEQQCTHIRPDFVCLVKKVILVCFRSKLKRLLGTLGMGNTKKIE